MIKEELLPGALDLAIKAKEKDEIATELHDEVKYRRCRLFTILAFIILAILVAVGLALWLLLKPKN